MISFKSLGTKTYAKATSASNATITLDSPALGGETLIIYNKSTYDIWVHDGSSDTSAPSDGNSEHGLVIAAGSTQTYAVPVGATVISVKRAPTTADIAYVSFSPSDKGA